MVGGSDDSSKVDWQSLSPKDQKMINPGQLLMGETVLPEPTEEPETVAEVAPIAEPLETVEAVSVEINPEISEDPIKFARDSLIPDPFGDPKHPSEISMMDFLFREFKTSHSARSKTGKGREEIPVIAGSILGRFESVEAIRALAESCRSEKIAADIESELKTKRQEQDKLWEATNDYHTATEKNSLKKDIASLEAALKERQSTGNNIYHYLTEVADVLEAKPQLWPEIRR